MTLSEVVRTTTSFAENGATSITSMEALMHGDFDNDNRKKDGKWSTGEEKYLEYLKSIDKFEYLNSLIQ